MFESKLDYIQQTFAPETPALQAVRESMTDPNDRISISPQEGKFLQVLIRLIGAKKIVEIGTLAGYSALWMAGALPADGKIYTLEKDEKRIVVARNHFQKFDTDKKIMLMAGDAFEMLPKLDDKGPFDLIFIDADKVQYARYLDWAEKNIRKGGLIVGDNTFLFDTVWRDAPSGDVRQTAWDAMRDFNRRLADSARYSSILLPTEQGLTVAQRVFD